MEVEVANGTWRHGAILSIRVGDTRRQAPLQRDTRIAFNGAPPEVDHMQVDIFARVGSTRIVLAPSQEVYGLNVDGEGFAGLALRIRGAAQVNSPGKSLSDAGRFGDLAATGGSLGEDEGEAEERLRQVRQNAAEYIERFDLRQVLQEMFQKVIKERPDDPFAFLQVFLKDGPGRRFQETQPFQASPLPEVVDASALKNFAGSAADGSLANKLAGLYDGSLVDKSAGPDQSAATQSFARASADGSLATKLAGPDQSAGMQSLPNVASVEADAEQEAARARREADAEQEAARARQAQLYAEQEAARQTQLYEQQHREQQGVITMLRQQVQELEIAARKPTSPVVRPPMNGRATPGDEAAGTPVPASRSLPNTISEEAAKTVAVASGVPQGTAPAFSGFQAATQPQLSSLQSSGALPQWAQASGLTSTSAGTEVNTHMLSQLLASTYAPPVAPTLYFEMREDIEEDVRNLELNPQSNPELLIEVIDCTDKTTNGTFAWVGTCNSRPLYRLLGPQPRYLYYASVDPAWAGWWIADKMGSEDYVEWFREPMDARLPVYCRKGELGSRVVEAKLTRETVQKINKIGNQAEKVTVRNKLTEAFGSAFIKLDGSQRGLMSRTSPVVGVAHALEAQQRAIQLLHSQLSAETHRREAAETHAQTMEEAFETLQLRIQAQLPGASASVQYMAPTDVGAGSASQSLRSPFEHDGIFKDLSA